MAKVPPEAILEISATEITLPENTVTLSGSQSRDRIRSRDTAFRGTINTFKFLMDGKVVYEGSNQATTVKNLTAGIHEFILVCTDKAGNSSDINSPNARKKLVVNPVPEVITKTVFGASGPSIDSVDTLRFICGEGAPTRTATWIVDYTSGGKRELETYINAKHPTFWNVNWKHPIKVGDQKNGAPFPTASDLNFYEDKVNRILSFYKDHPNKDLIIPCPFNEPTTDNFHDGPMSDYIACVKIFVRVAKSYGYKRITDGGVHIGTILGANDGDPNSTNKSEQVAYLLDEYAKIPELTWINAHTTNTTTYYRAQDIPDAQDKAFRITGRKLVSNENHVKNWEAVEGMCRGWFEAGVPYSVIISGTDPAYALNSGRQLTRIGEEYKKFIDAHR